MTSYLKYKVTKGDNLENLLANVETDMRHGWQPLGGVSQVKIDDHLYFIQTMVM